MCLVAAGAYVAGGFLGGLVWLLVIDDPIPGGGSGNGSAAMLWFGRGGLAGVGLTLTVAAYLGWRRLVSSRPHSS